MIQVKKYAIDVTYIGFRIQLTIKRINAIIQKYFKTPICRINRMNCSKLASDLKTKKACQNLTTRSEKDENLKYFESFFVTDNLQPAKVQISVLQNPLR